MIYIIFTTEGLAEAFDTLLADKAELWINDNVLNDEQQTALNKANISTNILPEQANPSNEKSVMTAVQYVEQHTDSAEIFVEYL